MMESVRGIVIGSQTITATLHTPNGQQYGNPATVENHSEAVAWAIDVRANAMNRVGPAECARLGWDGRWELRER